MLNSYLFLSFFLYNFNKLFFKGFWELIPVDVLKKNNITSNDLDLMITGKPSIDVEEIRAYTIFQGSEDFVDGHPQVLDEVLLFDNKKRNESNC